MLAIHNLGEWLNGFWLTMIASTLCCGMVPYWKFVKWTNPRPFYHYRCKHGSRWRKGKESPNHAPSLMSILGFELTTWEIGLGLNFDHAKTNGAMTCVLVLSAKMRRNERLWQTTYIGNMFGQYLSPNSHKFKFKEYYYQKNCTPSNSYLATHFTFPLPYTPLNLVQNLLCDQLWVPLL